MAKPILVGPPKWAENGMQVWIPYGVQVLGRRGDAVRCTVVCAAGYHIHIYNETYNVDKWVHIDSVYIEKNDLHGYDLKLNEI